MRKADLNEKDSSLFLEHSRGFADLKKSEVDALPENNSANLFVLSAFIIFNRCYLSFMHDGLDHQYVW